MIYDVLFIVREFELDTYSNTDYYAHTNAGTGCKDRVSCPCKLFK